MEDINLEKKEVESKENNENIDPIKSKIGLVSIAIITIFIIGFVWFVGINPKCDFTTNDYHSVFANNIEENHIYYNIEQEESLYTVKINNKYTVKNDGEYYELNLTNVDAKIFNYHSQTVVLSSKDYNKYIGKENNAVKANVYKYNLLFSKNIDESSNIGHSGAYIVFPWTDKNEFKNETSTKNFLQNESKKFLGLSYEDLNEYEYKLDISDNLYVNGNLEKLYD